MEKTGEMMIVHYLDVAEVAGGALSLLLPLRNELATNAVAVVAELGTGVDVETVTSGLKAVDDTADLDGAVDGGLLHHDLTRDVHTLDGDEGPARAFGHLGPGGGASKSNNYVTNNQTITL